ncbi:DUF948 domain-containing protein [Virgibacillus necropolis]|uniref:General stress protein n=1 Tax=Virgibacillus necropolis TaxID=163877 RepID=A0A221M7M5_9BACI|nr:DUF948 domain-containing protein [Virgibacillus necropolis]ASN03643.1 hypothetical protein CFK40_00765 [Virgibacillus necropolis]
MDWLGIGVLVIGVAFAVLVLVLIKPLNNLSNLFFSVQKTTDELPHNINLITDQTKNTLQASTETLTKVNNQVKELSPLFSIIGDAGRGTQKLSSSLVDATTSMKTGTEDGKKFTERHNLEGLYGALTLSYYLFQRKKALKVRVQK